MTQIETRPSGAPRWTRCALAPTLAATLGDPPMNDAAREGTCAAWAAEMVLTGRAPDAVSMIDQSHENGWVVDEEMAHHVQGYVDHCRARVADGGELWVEQYVALTHQIGGTLDCATLTPDGTLTISDLKYGYRPVKPDSEQLVIYAGAVLQGQRATRVVTEIYQPRAFISGGIARQREWTPDEIRARCEWIIERAADCRKPNPPGTPGPHCAYCAGAGRGCNALAATAAQIMAVVEDTDHGSMDAPALARQIDFFRWAVPTLKAASDAAEAEAIARYRAGDRLPGYGVSERMGQTKVTATRDQIRALTGFDLPVVEKPLTVGDLRKAGLSDGQIALFTYRPVIGMKLEPLDADDLKSSFKGVTNDA